MKTKTYHTYSLAELSPDARSKAISDHAQFLSSEFDGEATIEDAKTCFAFCGIEISNVFWSGFSSQGDGACFEGTWSAANVNAAGLKEHAPVDAELHRIADGFAAIAKLFPFASFSVKHSGRYSHEFCTDFTVSLPDPDLSDTGPYATAEDEQLVLAAGASVEQLRSDRASDDMEASEKDLIELARDSMRWIYKQLESEYDWQTAEPQVVESIEANEYEFTADGKID